MPDNYCPPKAAPAGAVHSSGELRAYSDIQKKGVLPDSKARELIRGYHAAQTGHMLCDHATDPGENVNVADDKANAEVVADLARRLQAGMGKPGDFR